MIIKNNLDILGKKSENTDKFECSQKRIFPRMEQALFSSEIPGYALTAVQIGEHIRACIIRGQNGVHWRLINPVISNLKDKTIFPAEGCLSFPGDKINTDRYKELDLEWIDFETGEKKNGHYDGIMAIIFQHELGHMNGQTIHDVKHIPVKKVGRNDSCPICLEQGHKMKWKKCKLHNTEVL